MDVRPFKFSKFLIFSLSTWLLSLNLGCSKFYTSDFASKDAELARKNPVYNPSDARISFFPAYQIFHRPIDFTIRVVDPKGFVRPPKVQIVYNQKNVTADFLRIAKWKRVSLNVFELNYKGLRLAPNSEHHISVSFRREIDGQTVEAEYLPPYCHIYADQKVTIPQQYAREKDTITQIIKAAKAKNINPVFLTGLVAQESSFDPKAVSKNKAIGLTQVTSLAETAILPHISGWPRYSAISELSYAEVQYLIAIGEITARNEWRLNAPQSIVGGAAYLKEVEKFWKKADKELLYKDLGDREVILSRLVLASYNSGATRVSEALERLGPRWLSDPELNAARQYINLAGSYCETFSNKQTAKL